MFHAFVTFLILFVALGSLSATAQDLNQCAQTSRSVSFLFAPTPSTRGIPDDDFDPVALAAIIEHLWPGSQFLTYDQSNLSDQLSALPPDALLIVLGHGNVEERWWDPSNPLLPGNSHYMGSPRLPTQDLLARARCGTRVIDSCFAGAVGSEPNLLTTAGGFQETVFAPPTLDLLTAATEMQIPLPAHVPPFLEVMIAMARSGDGDANGDGFIDASELSRFLNANRGRGSLRCIGPPNRIDPTEGNVTSVLAPIKRGIIHGLWTLDDRGVPLPMGIPSEVAERWTHRVYDWALGFLDPYLGKETANWRFGPEIRIPTPRW